MKRREHGGGGHSGAAGRQAATSRSAADRVLGPEAANNHLRRLREGFYDTYLSGSAVLDIGFRGGQSDAQPITGTAIGVELDYPGYDGTRLPFGDFSQDAVFASHTLEHIDDYRAILADWFRVLRIDGYLIIAVPHQHLYERKANLPSRFNGDHKRFYTPMSLLREVEESLPVAAYRIRLLRDVDQGFSYAVPPGRHATGSYEIELVVQKIGPPAYASLLVPAPEAAKVAGFFAEMLVLAIGALHGHDEAALHRAQALLSKLPLPPFRQLAKALPAGTTQPDLAAVLGPVLLAAPFDEAFYLGRHDDVRAAVQAGQFGSGQAHFVASGYFESRATNGFSTMFD